MKNLAEYITEAAEFELIKTKFREYGVVTLVRRENIDCANLTEDEFVKFMLEDIDTAIKEYTTIVKPINDERIKAAIEREVEQATKYAEKKYKLAKKRADYIKNARKNAENKKIFLKDPKRIFFDFKPDKGQNGIPSSCILEYDTDEKQLKECWSEISKSKYFKKATGWAFKYESYSKEKSSVFAFRPYVDLLLDESDKEEQKRDEENLTKSIQDFYSDTNYWGD